MQSLGSSDPVHALAIVEASQAVTLQYGTRKKPARAFLHLMCRSILILPGDLLSLRYETPAKGPMFQVIPIRDTQNNINAIHEVAKLEGVPASELLRRIAREHCAKAGYKIDDLAIKPGQHKGHKKPERAPKAASPKAKATSRKKVKKS